MLRGHDAWLDRSADAYLAPPRVDSLLAYPELGSDLRYSFGLLRPKPRLVAKTPAGSLSAPYRPPFALNGSEVQLFPSGEVRTRQSLPQSWGGSDVCEHLQVKTH